MRPRIRAALGLPTVALLIAAASLAAPDARFEAAAGLGAKRSGSNWFGARKVEFSALWPKGGFGGTFEEGSGHLFGEVEAHRDFRKFGLAIEHKASDLPLWLDPEDGTPVYRTTGLELYDRLPQEWGLDGRLGIHWMDTSTGRGQYGASALERFRYGPVSLEMEYGFYGTGAKRRLDSEHRPSSPIGWNFGSVRYTILGSAEVELYRRGDSCLALGAEFDFLFPHPEVEDLSPHRRDGSIYLQWRRFDTPRDPEQRPPAEGMSPSFEHLAFGLTVRENKLFIEREPIATVESAVAWAGYQTVGLARSMGIRIGWPLSLAVTEDQIPIEGWPIGRRATYFAFESHVGSPGQPGLSVEAEHSSSGISHISTVDGSGRLDCDYLGVWIGPKHLDFVRRPQSELQVGWIVKPEAGLGVRVGRDIPIPVGRTGLTIGISGEVAFDGLSRWRGASSRFSVQGQVAKIAVGGRRFGLWLSYQHNSTIQSGPVQSDDILAFYLTWGARQAGAR